MRSIAHIDAYTPGMWALATLSGKGDSQRSGFHSSASGPHTRVFVFACRMGITISVPFFKGMASISRFPSADLIGHASGSVTSSRVLVSRASLGTCKRIKRSLTS